MIQTDVALINSYQLSGRFHPYTCSCPTPIRDIDPPRAKRTGDAIRLVCARCDWDQAVDDDMLAGINSVMAMPETPWGDIMPNTFPRSLPMPAALIPSWIPSESVSRLTRQLTAFLYRLTGAPAPVAMNHG